MKSLKTLSRNSWTAFKAGLAFYGAYIVASWAIRSAKPLLYQMILPKFAEKFHSEGSYAVIFTAGDTSLTKEIARNILEMGFNVCLVSSCKNDLVQEVRKMAELIQENLVVSEVTLKGLSDPADFSELKEKLDKLKGVRVYVDIGEKLNERTTVLRLAPEEQETTIHQNVFALSMICQKVLSKMVMDKLPSIVIVCTQNIPFGSNAICAGITEFRKHFVRNLIAEHKDIKHVEFLHVSRKVLKIDERSTESEYAMEIFEKAPNARLLGGEITL